MVGVWKIVEVVVHVNDILPTDRISVVSLRLLSDPLRHQPVEGTHVEVHRCESNRVSPETLEAESGPELVEADESPIV